MLENVFTVPYDHKLPLCTLVLKSNVTLAQPLRLKMLCFFTLKSLADDRRLYLYARKMKLKIRCEWTDPFKKKKKLCIVYLLKTTQNDNLAQSFDLHR